VAVSDGGKYGAATIRVVVYCWDNFILMLPITRADQAASLAPAAAPAPAGGGGDWMGGSGGGGGTGSAGTNAR